MSLESWIKEFYQEDAETFTNKSDTECLDHSIQKWTGALPENLAKHGMKYDNTILHQENSTESCEDSNLEFDDTTCALCQKYENCVGYFDTKSCIIVEITGKPCHEVYNASYNDPTEMLTLLKYVKDINSINYPS